MFVTASYLQRLIGEAKRIGIDPKYIAEMEEQLTQLQSGQQPSATEVQSYQRQRPDGTVVMRFSTTALDPKQDHLFDHVPMKPIQRRVIA